MKSFAEEEIPDLVIDTTKDILEIAKNPYNLQISIQQDTEYGKWFFVINHRVKKTSNPVVETEALALNKKEAVAELEDFFNGICEYVLRGLKEPDSFVSKTINPNNISIDISRIVNPFFVKKVVKMFQSEEVAETICTHMMPEAEFCSQY